MALEQVAVQAAPEMIDGIQPLVDLVQPVFLKASLLVGGIFGIYLLLLIMRVHYERKKVKILQDIRYDLDHLNAFHGVKTSKQKKGFFGKIIRFFKKKSIEKKMAKEFYGEEEEEKIEIKKLTKNKGNKK